MSELGGVVELYEAWLTFISTAMVKRTRFDPFTNADTEQQLFDALPALTRQAALTGGTTAAIFPELVLEEGLEPWREQEETWLMGPAGGETVIDISETFDRKVRALECHRSQIGEWDVRAFMAKRLAERGAPHGYAYAESFRVIDYRR